MIGSSSGKRAMQNVSFQDVQEFLDFLPKEQRVLVDYLRELVFDCIPAVREKLSYNVPFYKLHRNICFIWPSAVTWSGMKQEGVRFGFTAGHLMRDDIGYLDKGLRKQVYWKDFSEIRDIDRDLLRAYIFEAVRVDASGIK